MKVTKRIVALLLAALMLTALTSCGKSPEEKAADAIKDALGL